MKFGTKVLVHRGSEGRPQGTPGCARWVKGTLIGARGHERYVRLDQDDPYATLGWCTKKGDVGNWSNSVVKEREYFNFWDLEFHWDPGMGGKFARLHFKNGWGVSVVCHAFSHGGPQGLYELAVLRDDELHYNNTVAKGDVQGWLTPSEVSSLMWKIQRWEKE
jgi:hypothetical protein